MSERIVIVGGSISGLGMALALSRKGHEVTVLERDRALPPDSPEAMFTNWDRPSVPQLRHSHGFLARLRKLVRHCYPDLHAALLAAGIVEQSFVEGLPDALASRYAPCPEDEDLTVWFCRRTTFEGVLNRYVRTQPGVHVYPGVQATGVMAASNNSVPRLTGITARHAGTTVSFPANTIIDASGRRSPFPTWLRAHGCHIAEETEPTGSVYYTRFYRLRDACRVPDWPSPASRGGDLGYVKFGIYPADNHTFSCTLAVPTVERDLHILRHRDAFTQVCNAIPMLAPWVETRRAEPLSDVLAMGSLHNSYRHYVRNGQAVVHGYFAVGEAAVHTNPLYGLGCTLSFLNVHLLADFLHSSSDPETRAVQFQEATDTHLRPFYDAAVRRDREGLQRARQGIEPKRLAPWRQRLKRSLVQHGLTPAVQGNLEVSRAHARDLHMLEPPGVPLRRARILLRILYFWLREQRRQGTSPPPTHGPARQAMWQQLGLTAAAQDDRGHGDDKENAASEPAGPWPRAALGRRCLAGQDAGSPRSSMRIKRIRTLAELDAIASIWTDLAETSQGAYVFQSWQWNRLWCEYVLGRRSHAHLDVRIIEDGAGRAMAILPLFTEPIAGPMVHVTQFLGHRMSYHNDILLADSTSPELAGRVATALRHDLGRRTLLHLRHLDPDSMFTQHLLGQQYAEPQCPRLWLEPDATLTDQRMRLGRARRKSLRLAENRLRRLGTLTFRIRTGPDFPVAFDELVTLHQRRFASMHRSTLLLGSHVAFLKAATTTLSAAGTFEIMQLCADDVTIAAALMAYDRGRYFFIQSGFDPAFARFSPMRLLLTETMRRGFEELGCSRYDLGPGYEPYKLDWSSVVGTNYACYMGSNPYTKSMAALYRYAFRRRISSTSS